MKGIIIWEDNEIATYCELIKNACSELTQYAPKTIMCSLKGEALETSKAVCSKDDTYDFETGALIALMKKCGLEKSAKAYAEIFDDTAYGDALIERDKLKRENESLKEAVKSLKAAVCARKVLHNRLRKDYNSAQSSYEIMVEKSADLMDKVKDLEESNKCLCEEIERLRDYNKSLEDSRDRLLIESRNRLKDKIDLKEKYVALAAENEKLNNEVNLINDALNAWKKRYRDLNTANGDLVCENYKLKTDCEKLQHGYIDNETIFCGGSQNGKQFTFLVELFKKLPQDEVEAAYKKVYHATLPAWQKEVLNRIYGKAPSWLDGKKWNYVSIDELAFKPVSKREKMWDDILKEGRTPVWVKREDIHDFLEECQVAGIKWSSGKSPLETMPFYMTDGYDGAYFFVMTSLDITKSKKGAKKFRRVMTWWATACPDEAKAAIHYIRPMRWDLFEKGRIAVKVNKENYSEFCMEVFNHFTKVGMSAFNHACKFGYFVFNKDTNYVDRVLVSDNGDAKEINRRKVVDWEDVR